jgi:hypothetical protein
MAAHWRTGLLAAAALIALQAAVLYLFGQPAICACGYIKWWEGVVLSAGNSQHLTDWYSISHVLHGILFYWLLSKFFPKVSVAARLAVAVGVEVTWEIIENTPWLIEHYRQQALAQGYTGDSILNSVSDTVAMIVGFVAAWRLPAWVSMVALIALEALMLYCIRDSLTLNILNLIYPLDAVSQWQSGL